MLKGTQKKIIHIKDTHSNIFGEAYFVLRTDIGTEVSENEMVREAARIVDENLLSIYCSNEAPGISPIISKPKKSKSGAVAGFIAGASVCSGIIGLIILLIQLT